MAEAGNTIQHTIQGFFFSDPAELPERFADPMTALFFLPDSRETMETFSRLCGLLLVIRHSLSHIDGQPISTSIFELLRHPFQIIVTPWTSTDAAIAGGSTGLFLKGDVVLLADEPADFPKAVTFLLPVHHHRLGAALSILPVPPV